MAYTVTATIANVINEARQEVVMSVQFDDGLGDIRTLTSKGKTKTQAEGKQLLDGILARYQEQVAREARVASVIATLESDAKTYLETELNG